MGLREEWMFKHVTRWAMIMLLVSMLAACGASSTGTTGGTTTTVSAAQTPATGGATTAAQTTAPAMAMTTTAPAMAMTTTAPAMESSTTMAMMTETATTSMMASATTGGTMMSETAPAGMTASTTGSMSGGAALAAANPDKSVTADLKASGASFPAKIYQRWIEQYKGVVPGVAINYQSVGSGQGVKDYLGSITDFGATDAFLTNEELGKAPNTLHIPMVAGAVVATYNLKGVEKLQFSPDTLANIFLGKITKWNDPKIAADNSGVSLPDTNITVVYRADGSGTNSIFTEYLSAVSPDFKSQVGAGKTVKWPVGQGEQKNDGVAKAVTATDGAIGYVELIYALGNKLPAPAIKNAAGNFVAPTLESVSATANGFLAQLPEDLRINIVNPPTGADAYPISGFTWLIVQKEQKDQAKAKALTDFIYWCLSTGDEEARKLGFSPLPNEVKARAVQKLEQITANGQPVFKRP